MRDTRNLVAECTFLYHFTSFFLYLLHMNAGLGPRMFAVLRQMRECSGIESSRRTVSLSQQVPEAETRHVAAVCAFLYDLTSFHLAPLQNTLFHVKMRTFSRRKQARVGIGCARDTKLLSQVR